MVAERKRVDRLNLRISTRKRVPPSSYRNEGGTNGSTSKKRVFLMHFWWEIAPKMVRGSIEDRDINAIICSCFLLADSGTHSGHPLAPFWLSFGSLWLSLPLLLAGSLWLPLAPFGSLWLPLAPFGSLRLPGRNMPTYLCNLKLADVASLTCLEYFSADSTRTSPASPAVAQRTRRGTVTQSRESSGAEAARLTRSCEADMEKEGALEVESHSLFS